MVVLFQCTQVSLLKMTYHSSNNLILKTLPGSCILRHLSHFMILQHVVSLWQISKELYQKSQITVSFIRIDHLTNHHIRQGHFHIVKFTNHLVTICTNLTKVMYQSSIDKSHSYISRNICFLQSVHELSWLNILHASSKLMDVNP